MRIKFQPLKPISKINITNDIQEFDIPYLLFLHTIDLDEPPVVDYIQSYTDNCRYDLHITKAWLPHVDQNMKVQKGHFCFIEMKTWFEIPFNFILFDDNYANYWDRDSDIYTIKPRIIVAGNQERHLAIAAFRSIASSFLRKIADRIPEKCNLTIIKKYDKFVIGFKLTKDTEKAIDFVIENFANAIYEIVKATEYYGYYELPEIDYKVPVNMAQQYHLKKQRKFLQRNKRMKIEK